MKALLPPLEAFCRPSLFQGPAKFLTQKLYRGLVASLIGLSLLASPVASAFDDPEAVQLMRDQAAPLIKAGDFDGFDQLASEFRAFRSRTSSGEWKLYLLYCGIRWIRPKSGDDPQWALLETTARDWIQAHPQSPTGPILLAEILSARAWTYRGKTYSTDIPPQNIDPFRNYVDKARSVLDASRTVSHVDPNWYRLRIEIANLDGEAPQVIMDLAHEGLAKEPDFHRIAASAAVALQPRWGGSPELIKQFVDAATENSKLTEGAQIYARTYLVLQRIDASRRNLIDAAGLDWPRMRTSLDEMVRAYPSAWNLNLRRATTCSVGTADDYRSLMAGFTGPVINIERWDTPQWRTDCNDWAFHGKVFQQIPQSDLAKALALFRVFEQPISWALLIVLSFAVAVITQRAIPQSQENPYTTLQDSGRPRAAEELQPPLSSSLVLDPSLFPRIYWVSRKWQFICLSVGGLLNVIGDFLIASVCVAQPTNTWQIPALVLVTGLIVAGIGTYIAVYARRTRLTIAIDYVELRGVFQTRRIPTASILGRYLIRGHNSPSATVLMPKVDLDKPLKIKGVFATDIVYETWLRAIPDLDGKVQ